MKYNCDSVINLPEPVLHALLRANARVNPRQFLEAFSYVYPPGTEKHSIQNHQSRTVLGFETFTIKSLTLTAPILDESKTYGQISNDIVERLFAELEAR